MTRHLELLLAWFLVVTWCGGVAADRTVDLLLDGRTAWAGLWTLVWVVLAAADVLIARGVLRTVSAR